MAKNGIRNIGDLRIDILRTKKDIDMRFSLKGDNYQSAFFFIRIEWAVYQVRPQNFKISRTESVIDMRFSLKGGHYKSAFFFIRIEWAVHQVRPQNFKISRTESDIDMRFSLKGSPRPTISYSRYSRPWVATTLVP